MDRSEITEAAWLMSLRINNPEITAKMRIYRECDAMLAHYLARGLGPATEQAKEIERRANLMERRISQLDDVSHAELIALHTLLADAIKPALPKSIELFHFDAQKPLLNWIAPVGSIRTLVAMTFVATALLFYVLIYGSLQGNHDTGLLAKEQGAIGAVLIFYMCLAALGACFSVLYDARKYVVEGTFDPRVGSNYPIRILLGIMSGVILSQLLFDSVRGTNPNGTPQEQVSAITRPLVALLGGFSGQFVYRGLQKLVDSLTLVFSNSPEDEIENRERVIKAEVAESIAKRDAQRSATGAKLAAELAKVQDNPERTAQVMDELLKVAVGDADVPTQPVDEEDIDAVLNQARAIQNLGEAMLDVLPDDDTLRIRGGLSRIIQKISDVEGLIDQAKSFEAASVAKDLKAILDGDEPVRQALLSNAKTLVGAATTLGLVSNPAGVALGALLGSVEIASEAQSRWKALVLNAKVLPHMLPPSLINETTVRVALENGTNNTLIDAIKAAGFSLGDNAFMSDLGTQIVEGQDDALFDKIGGGLARDAFDTAVDHFRKSILGNIVEVDVPSDALTAIGEEKPSKLLGLLDALQSDAESETALQRITILADHLRDTKNTSAQATLKALFRKVAKEVLA